MKLLFLLICSLKPGFALAASCCGGGSAFPGVVTGDYKGQLTSTLIQGEVIADAINGEYFKREEPGNDTSKTVILQTAWVLKEAWQASLTVPVIERKKVIGSTSEGSTGLGDISLGLNYEILPELTYSWWKPRGFSFFTLHLPTSPSKYETTDSFNTEARGDGFYALSTGVLFTRTLGSFDLLAGASLRYRLNRSIQSKEIKPGTTHTIAIGSGYNLPNSNYRLGLTVEKQHTSSYQIFSEEQNSTTSNIDVWNTTITANYLIQLEWMVALNYSDQTLLGPANNSPLERSIGVQLQKRWSL